MSTKLNIVGRWGGQARWVGFVCLIAPIGLFLIGSSITRIRGFNPNSSVTPQDSVPANCLDEKGHLMTNEDGFIQLRCLDRNAQIAESGDASAIRNLTDTVFEFSQIGR